MKPLKILVKFPTRSRPQQFLNVLNLLNEKATDRKNIEYLISIDDDDPTMTGNVLTETIKISNILIGCEISNNKIHACNRDIEKVKKWDIIVLMSDDMIPQLDGWDEIIRQGMTKYHPDTDGCLWFNDGYQDRVCTLVIMGRVYYNRFNYLYHPDYNSLFCDNEQTEVAQGLDKMTYFTTVIFKHSHFANDPTVKRDALYKRNEAYFNLDKTIFEKRKSQGFPIE